MHPSANHTSPSPTAAILLFFFLILLHHSSAAVDTFVYVGCSQAKFTPATPYENSVDSILTSLVNSASLTSFYKLTVGGSTTGGSVYGLFQCRPDLPTPACSECVARAVSQIGVLCANSAGAVLQLDGCLVRYDNVAFLGILDKSLVSRKCGAPAGDSAELSRRDSVLGYLSGGAQAQQMFRVVGSGTVQGVAECVGDLSAAACQDCLAEAVGRLKSDCGSAAWGDVYLAKCYARYSVSGSHAHANSDAGGSTREEDETEKTLAILIGLIAVVAVAVIFLAFLRKLCEEKGGK